MAISASVYADPQIVEPSEISSAESKDFVTAQATAISQPKPNKYPRIGQFYRERVAGRHDLLLRELTITDNKAATIEQNLFGYRVATSNGFLDCRSETEARFLRVFVDLGVREIGVPQDDNFLLTILPELESLKQRIDNLLEPYMLTLNPRLRAELRRSAYAKVAQ